MIPHAATEIVQELQGVSKASLAMEEEAHSLAEI